MSVYISNLPEYTGNTYNGYIVWNDSGETTTYKTKYFPSGLVNGTGVDSIVSANWLTSTYGANPISSGLASIAIGSSNSQATNAFSLAIGWNARALTDGAISIGASNTSNGAQAITIGYASAAAGTDAVCIGVESNAGGFRAVAIGKYATATGSESTAIGNATTVETNYSTTLGGVQLIRNSQYSNIIGGRNQTIITNTPYNNIFGASDSDIRTDNNTGGLNTIIGGIGNYMSGATSGTTLIGLRNYTQPLLNDLTYTNNYHALRTYSTQVQAISSGDTFTCNLNNGGKAQYYLTGNTTIDITNVRDGQSFIIKTQTNGNYTITWSATGYTFVFEGGTKDPGNTTTDLFVFEVFGSVIYGNRRHNYS